MTDASFEMKIWRSLDGDWRWKVRLAAGYTPIASGKGEKSRKNARAEAQRAIDERRAEIEVPWKRVHA